MGSCCLPEPGRVHGLGNGVWGFRFGAYAARVGVITNSAYRASGGEGGERQCRLRRGVHFLLGTCGLGFRAFDLEFSASEYFGLPRRLVRFLCLAFEGARRVQVWCRDILGPRLSVFLKPQH